MNSFENLQEQIDIGEIKLIQSVGVPRSVSTAFCRALANTDAPSIFINEPFNRETADLEGASKNIINSIHELDFSDKPTLVIIKNMASYVRPKSFEALDNLCSGTIWNVRDPLVQIGSLLTRIVNDLKIGSGASGLEQAEIYPYIDQACDYLVKSNKSTNFSKTGWESIGKHFRNRTGELHLAIDGEEFTNNPYGVLCSAADRLRIPFSEDMVTGWNKGFINVINRDNLAETEQNAWTSRAARSIGILALTREALEADKLPESLRDHIENTAVPVYQEISQEANINR